MLASTSTTLLNSLLEQPADQQAWRVFSDRYGPAIHRFARRQGLSEADAEEVVSDTLATFFKAYSTGTYDRSRGRFKNWLFGLTLNRVRAIRRARQRSGTTAAPDELEDRLSADQPDPQFEADVDRSLAQQCLDSMRTRVSPLTYQAFDLYALKGLSVREVAKLLGMDVSAVYVAKSRVLASARKEYERLRDQDDEV